MVAKDVQEQTNVPAISANDDGEGWETVQDESPDRIIFDTIGDTYVGLFLGIEHVIPESNPEEDFYQAHFYDEDSPKVIAGGYSLMRALQKVEVGREARMLYVKDIDTGKKDPMKDFKVWARDARPEWRERAAQARKVAVASADARPLPLDAAF